MAQKPQADKNRQRRRSSDSEGDSSNPFDSSEDQDNTISSSSLSGQRAGQQNAPPGAALSRVQSDKTIPKNLLTRILYEFFEKEATRISKDANSAVGKYVDVFVREAIARAAVEKRTGFLEVEDLEKVAPQLLLDL